MYITRDTCMCKPYLIAIIIRVVSNVNSEKYNTKLIRTAPINGTTGSANPQLFFLSVSTPKLKTCAEPVM